MEELKEFKYLIWKVFWYIICLCIFIGIISYSLSWCRNMEKVASNQFSPQSLLEKYEWFKNVSDSLEKKHAEISVFEMRIENLKNEYDNERGISWSREDCETYNLIISELVGIKAIYNQLTSEYNLQMVKFNYKFINVEELPQGTQKVLPREYESYTTR